jgi:hypothetical protein
MSNNNTEPEHRHLTKTMTNVGKLTLLTETKENLSINTSVVILDGFNLFLFYIFRTFKKRRFLY